METCNYCVIRKAMYVGFFELANQWAHTYITGKYMHIHCDRKAVDIRNSSVTILFLCQNNWYMIGINCLYRVKLTSKKNKLYRWICTCMVVSISDFNAVSLPNKQTYLSTKCLIAPSLSRQHFLPASSSPDRTRCFLCWCVGFWFWQNCTFLILYLLLNHKYHVHQSDGRCYFQAIKPLCSGFNQATSGC